MFISISKPFLSSHYMGDFHLPIIYHVRQVKRWPSIATDNHEIVECFELYLPEYLIIEMGRMI